jgi:porphobilinogen deaminase
LAPATAHARIAAGSIAIDAAVGATDGTTLLRDHSAGPEALGETLAEQLAARMLAAGAGDLLRRARR